MKYKLVKISKIEKKQYKGKVYDLTVSNTHSYNINGIIVHNSVCETKTETGIYMPMVSAIQECVSERKLVALERIPGHRFRGQTKDERAAADECMKGLPLIIADGGIKTPADMCKILAVGADLIMAGGIFAGTVESPGDVHNFDGMLVKLYRGAASFSVQRDHNGGKKPTYVEGREGYVKYRDIEVSKVIKRFKGGLESSMSYMNARTLDEFRGNVTVIEIN